MTDIELNEFKDFIGENSIRNKFLPIMEHICKLKPKDFKVEEYGDKEGRTSSIRFEIDAGYDDLILGRVGYDWCGDIKPEVKNNIIFELWWGGECYCLKDNIVETQNMLTILIKKIKFNTGEETKKAQKSKILIPIPK